MNRWLRFEDGGSIGFGKLDAAGERIELHEGNLFLGPLATGQFIDYSAVRPLAPIVPSKFIGLWNNFGELATKLGNARPTTPLYFIKTPNSYLEPGGAIRVPAHYQGRIFYEGELGIVIGRRCYDVSEDEAASAIFGYTCVNDVTAIDFLTEDASFAQWARAKSCDTFGPFGPVVAEGIDWRELSIRTLVNGRQRQDFRASDMIISPERIVSLLSREITLEAGDLIACGTSLGALPMKPGTTVEVVIEPIGTLTNTFSPTGAVE